MHDVTDVTCAQSWFNNPLTTSLTADIYKVREAHQMLFAWKSLHICLALPPSQVMDSSPCLPGLQPAPTTTQWTDTCSYELARRVHSMSLRALTSPAVHLQEPLSLRCSFRWHASQECQRDRRPTSCAHSGRWARCSRRPASRLRCSAAPPASPSCPSPRREYCSLPVKWTALISDEQQGAAQLTA